MKKILLSLVAMLTIALNANAQAEPTYTVKGAMGYVPAGWESYPSILPVVKNLDVDVYGNDSIVFHDYCGVAKNDFVAVLDGNGTVTSVYCNYYSETQEKWVTYSYSAGGWTYVWTGLTSPDPDRICVYTGVDYSPYEKDDDTQTGNISFAYAYAYDGQTYVGTGAFYLSWAPATSAISSVAASDAAASDAVYNLAGQRVSPNTKGLVIKNGKKMLVK